MNELDQVCRIFTYSQMTIRGSCHRPCSSANQADQLTGMAELGTVIKRRQLIFPQVALPKSPPPMANAHYTRSLPKPPASLPAYEFPISPSSSPKPPVDLTSAAAFDSSMPSPPYAENASYTQDTSFAQNTPCAKNSPAQLSAAQQLYASSFANRGPTIATLPPPSFETPRRHGHQQPSFYKNQMSSYVQQSSLRARSPDSALPSTPPSTNTRFISSPTHLRSTQSLPYSGNSVSDGSLRTAPSTRDFGPRPNSATYARGRAELDRPMIATEMSGSNRTSAYTVSQETRNLFPLRYVDTVKPRELRNATTTVNPPPSFGASQFITSNVVGVPPHASAPLSPLQTGGQAQPLPVIVSSPPPPPPLPFNSPQQPQQQPFAAPRPQGYLQPNIAPQRPPNISTAIGSSHTAGTNRNRASRLMDGITSLATSLGQLAVKSSTQSLLSGSSIEEGTEETEETEGGDSSGAGFLDFFGLDAASSISAGGDSEDLSTGMTLVPQSDAWYDQDPNASFSVVLPRFSIASGSAQYNPQNVNNTCAIGHAYTGQSHLPVSAQQPYMQPSQQPAYNPY